MRKTIHKLLVAVLNEEDDPSEAILALGLLIERERIRLVPPSKDGGLQSILGRRLASLRLGKSEIREIVDSLLDHVKSSSALAPSIVWAVIKCYESRIVPRLVTLLHESVAQVPPRIDLASACLNGIIVCGVGTDRNEIAMEAILFASGCHVDEVNQQATDYLKVIS